MKKILLFLFIGTLFCLTKSSNAQVLFQDDFDSYVTDSIIDPQSVDWTGWDGMPTSAYVSDDTSYSANNSMKIWNATVPGSSVSLSDVVYLFGNKTSGRYLITFKVYVPSFIGGVGAGTYWNMLHIYNGSAIGAEWAFEVYLLPPGQNSHIQVGGATYPFTAQYDRWVKVAHILDLDNDVHEFYYNGQLVMSQPFSYSSLSTIGTLQLAAVDFYAECGGTLGITCVEEGYIDDFSFQNFAFQSHDVGLTELFVPDYCSGNAVNLDATVKNFGMDTINTVTIEWSIDGVLQTPIIYSSASILPDSSAVVGLGSYLFAGGSHNVKAWTSMPNASPDTINFNDTLMVTVHNPSITGPSQICPSTEFILSATGSGVGVSYDWEYYDSTSASWVSANGFAQYLTVFGGIASPTSYRVIITCAGGGSDTSNIHAVSFKPIVDCYCQPEYSTGCGFDDDINSFTLNGVNATVINDLNTGCSPNAYDDKTLLPAIDLVAGLTHHGTISSTATFGNQYSKIWIDFGDDGIFQDSTDLVGTVGPVSNITVPFTIRLGSLADSGLHRMRIRNVYGGNLFNFDACSLQSFGETHDYMVNVITPQCAIPYALAAGNITFNSATLSWNEAGISTEWEVEYGPAGFILGTGLDSVTSNNPLTIGNLNASTTYEFYVRAICGRNDSSYWAGPFSFMTSFVVPYFQDFENFATSSNGLNNIEGWNSYANIWPQWQSGTFTGSFNTGPDEDHTIGVGGTFVFLETIGGNTGDFDSLVSPWIYVDNNITDLSVKFWYHMFGTGMGDLEVYIDTNGITQVIDTIKGQHHTSGTDPWTLHATHNLTGFGGESVRLIFKGVKGSFESNMAIDDVSLIETPSCLLPSSLSALNISDTSADLSWVENNTATEWIVEYGISGFTYGTGINDTVTGKPFNIHGLLPNTEYEFYVRSICGRNDTSFVAGPFKFVTLCASVDFYPYVQNFISYVPSCWEEADNGLPTTGPFNFGFSAWNQDDFMNDFNNGSGISVNLWSVGKEDWLISEPFDLSGSTVQPYELRMKVGITEFSGSGPESMGSDDEVQVLISSDGGLTWNNLFTWNLSNQPGNTPAYQSISLASYTGTNNIIALWASEGTVNDLEDYDFHITDFEIRETPTCLEVSNMGVNNIGSFSADLSWQENNSATKWQIQYGPMGFTLGTGIDSIVSTNPKTLNGLAANTSYDFYVRSICGRGDTSFWMGPVSFMTLLPPCTGSPSAVTVVAPSSICAGIGFQLIAAGATLANGISYEWQLYDSTSSSWVATGMTNSTDSVVAGLFQPTSYRFITYCSFTGLSDTSNPVLIGINPPLQCYCTPQYGNGCTFGDDINDFTLNGAFGTSINDLGTGCSPTAFDDRTNLPIIVMEIDSTYNGTISSNYTFPSEYAKIWIDFDDDGRFDPADSVGVVGPFANVAIGYSIQIPLGVDSGLHRMRVRSVFGANTFTFDACSSEFYGETHDYMVFIGSLVACAGSPDSAAITGPSTVCAASPFSISTTGITFANGIAYQWEESPQGANTWTAISGATSPNLVNASGISTATDYRLITTCTNSGLSDTTNVLSISINPPTQCYCVPEYSTGCTFGDDINSVSLNGVNNTSINDINTGCSAGSYDDKTGLPPVDLVAGLTHHGAINSSYNFPYEYAKIWIDFGDDGFFTDSVDLVGTVGPFSTTMVPFTITIPSTANAGQHRMRIRNVYFGTTFTFDACSSETYGETHDYRVNVIVPTCKVPSALTANATTFNALLDWIENGIATEWHIEYGVKGFMKGNGIKDTVLIKPFQVNGLSPDTEYDFYVRSICGGGDSSYYAGPFTFRTGTTVPYSEDFETFGINTTGTLPLGWSTSTILDPQWESGTTTGSLGTGPIADHTVGSGGTFMYLETSGGILGDSSDLVSPAIVSDTNRNVDLTFWYHMYGATMGDLVIMLDSGNTTVALDTISGQQQTAETDPWIMRTISFPMYSGSPIRLRFRGIRGNGIESDMSIDDVSVDFTTGLELVDPSGLSNISIYPNPSKGVFHIIGNQVKEKVEISIFNTNGKLVYQSSDKYSNNFDETIDISGFSKGLYFVKLQSESSMEMKKIVIQ